MAGFLATTVLQPAMAAAPSLEQEREPVEFSFRFSRAELATERGAQRVYEQLVRKAGKACALPRTGSPGLLYKDGTCVAGLVEKTVRKIDAALLTSRWLRSTPGMSPVPQPVAVR